jgi:hypothetical protein
VLEASAVPQSSQNADEGAFSAPHFGHRLEIGLPHTAQNFLPVLLSVPHFEQRIDPNRLFRNNAILYHQRSLADIADCLRSRGKFELGII